FPYTTLFRSVLVLERLQPPSLGYLEPAILRLPVVDRRFRYPVPSGQVGGLRARLGLLQHTDDLLFGKSLTLHLVRPSMGRTLIERGGKSGGQVRTGEDDFVRWDALFNLGRALNREFESFVGDAKFHVRMTPTPLENPLDPNAMTHGLSNCAALYNEADRILKG